MLQCSWYNHTWYCGGSRSGGERRQCRVEENESTQAMLVDAKSLMPVTYDRSSLAAPVAWTSPAHCKTHLVQKSLRTARNFSFRPSFVPFHTRKNGCTAVRTSSIPGLGKSTGGRQATQLVYSLGSSGGPATGESSCVWSQWNIPGEGICSPTWYSPENSMDCIVKWGLQSQIWLTWVISTCTLCVFVTYCDNC